MENLNIGVLGAGGWGTSLALVLSSNGYEVTLWSHDENLVSIINQTRKNPDYLPGVEIDNSISVTSNTALLADCEWLVNTIPTQFIKSTILNYNLPMKNKFIINGSKGVEVETLCRISEIFQKSGDIDSSHFAVLTGPSHAEEVSRKTPTTIVGASENIIFAHEIQQVFSNEYFRVYASDDVTGCELGGSLKNVIAIAAGIIDGLGLGDNTKAALITRGLAEISRLGVAMGAKAITFSGLSGLGDLFVTCNSRHSRNRKVGELLGSGLTLEDITSQMKMVAEGVYTTKAAIELGKKHNVEMPISEQVYRILFENVKPMEAIHDLMTRQSKREWWW
ncbi:MAG: NAD(P)-dependent glycerol-3-phosphate dehydrogenase [Candidatus Kapabacteria bacterium]|nr:NAD(P)-dependent glycerol-3-phosphate dehydrogenase [Ignavibacteriota bacterium]MCW5885569.1 NAD(P)-dependent glycerol-3-phosphate dehydrogenase [Candidatus Kapabacteria bacterium]